MGLRRHRPGGSPAGRRADAAGGTHTPGRLSYGLLGAGAFLALYVPQPILPLLDRAFGTPPPLTGLTMTAALLGFAASGLLPEGGSPARTLWIALAAVVVASVAAAVAPSIWALLAARLVQGVGVGLLVAGGLADVARRAGGRGGALTGAMIGGTALGGMLSRLSGYLAFLLGWRGAFLVGGGLALVLVAIALNRLGLTRLRPRPGDDPASASSAAAPSLAASPVPAPGGAGRDGGARLVYAAGLFILFVNIAVFDLLPYRLAGAPFHLPGQIADAVYLAFLPATLTGYLVGPAIDRFGPRRVALATVLIGVACLLVGLLPNLVAAAVMATGSICGSVALHTCHSGAAAARSRRAVGRYLTAYYVGGAASAPLAATLYQAGGWPAAVLPLAGAWAVVGGLALAGSLGPGPRPGPSPA